MPIKLKVQEKFNDHMDLLGPFESKPHIAVAVSGGSDSLALTFLLKEWIQKKQGTLNALIINHNLRPEAEKEAHYVKDLLKSFQISAFILKNDKKIIRHRIQEQARHLRYELLQEWCRHQNILHLCLGHHQDDQQETFIIRQAKKSGDLGLSGMSCLVETPHVRLLRPLLNFTKQDLRSYLTQQEITYVEDPSNLNPKFTRVAVRHYLCSGVDKKKISLSLIKKGDQRINQENYINALIHKYVQVFEHGYGVIEENFFKQLPLEDQIHILQRCLMTFGTGPYPAPRESVRNLLSSFGKTRTLKGCMILHFKHKIYIFRELNASYKKERLVDLKKGYWDDRWKIIYPSNSQASLLKDFLIGPLQEEGWHQIKDTTWGQKIKFLPAPLRFALPSLWQEKKEKVLLNSVCSKFTNLTDCAIHFIPRYPLTRFVFKKFY